MRSINRTGLGLGILAGMTTLSAAGLMMGQGSTQPSRDTGQPGMTRPDPRSEYFVTGDAFHANLWAREGTTLRWVSSADANRTEPGIRTPAEPRNPTDPAPRK